MTKEEQDKLLSGTIGGGLGFLLAWLLKRCPQVAGEIYVEKVWVPWRAEPGMECTIEVLVWNGLEEPVYSWVYCQINNDFLHQEPTLAPGETVITFYYIIPHTVPVGTVLNLTASVFGHHNTIQIWESVE